MRAEVILSPGEFDRYDLTGKTAIVIDVFRFTTTVLTALEAGMERFYPVEEIEDAWALKERDPSYLLAGERKALRIPGFDFGNSPLEHHGKRYAGGDLVCSTTNGTRAIHATKAANHIVLASLRSAWAVADYIMGLGSDVVFLPAGTDGRFSLEDSWCAGLMLDLLKLHVLGDGARTAKLIYAGIRHSELRTSTHGQRMQSLSLEEDLEFCLELNSSSGIVTWDPESGWGSLVR